MLKETRFPIVALTVAGRSNKVSGDTASSALMVGSVPAEAPCTLLMLRSPRLDACALPHLPGLVLAYLCWLTSRPT